MTDQPTEHPTDRLTFAEAADRLGITPNAVRLRVRRGTLATITVAGESFVVWPQPARASRRSPTDHPNDAATTARDDALIAQLRDENRYLREQLDHQTRIVAVMAQRLAELPSGEPAQDAAQTQKKAPLRDAGGETASESLWQRVRRWIVGG
jgi:hypothetical protein